MDQNTKESCDRKTTKMMADLGKIDRPVQEGACDSTGGQRYEAIVRAVYKGLDEVSDDCYKANTDSISSLSGIKTQEAKLDYYNAQRLKLEKALDILTS